MHPVCAANVRATRSGIAHSRASDLTKRYLTFVSSIHIRVCVCVCIKSLLRMRCSLRTSFLSLAGNAFLTLAARRSIEACISISKIPYHCDIVYLLAYGLI